MTMSITGLHSVSEKLQNISGVILIMKNWSTWVKTNPITILPTTDLGSNSDLHIRDQQITTTTMPETSRTDNLKEEKSFNVKMLTVSMKNSVTFIKF